MIIREMTVEDAEHVMARMRESDRIALNAAAPGLSVPEFAADRMKTDLKYTLCAGDGEPVVIGGGKFINKNTVAVWMVATDRIAEVRRALIIFCRRFLAEIFALKIAHRFHGTVLDSRAECKRFAEFFGFKVEGAHPMAGANGETLLTYGRTE